MILKTIGFILRAIKFRESDLILTVLSRDYERSRSLPRGRGAPRANSARRSIC
jgi:recombinational DNA repair protein (RecF pathway)